VSKMYMTAAVAVALAASVPAAYAQNATPHEQNATKHEQTATKHEQTATPHEQNAATREQTATPHKQTAAPDEQPATPHEQTAAPDEQTATPHEQTGAPDEQTATPHEQTAAPDEQPATTHETQATAANETLPQGIQPDEVRASKMIGSALYDSQNRKVGSVADVILNKAGKVDAVVIDVGSFLGMGGKDVAVLPSEIKTDNNRLTLDRTKEQLQQQASYSLENRNTGAGTSTSPVEGGRLHNDTSSGR
jgi:sporulation protein YlmC with PRC-barrel domain